jgi:hypothetical protein
VVRHLPALRKDAVAGTVEVEVHRGVEGADERLQPSSLPVAEVAREGAPRSVLGAQPADGGDVRPGVGLGARHPGRAAQEGEGTDRAVAHGRFGDGPGQRYEAVGLVEERAEVEPAVVGRAELRRLLLPIGRARQRGPGDESEDERRRGPHAHPSPQWTLRPPAERRRPASRRGGRHAEAGRAQKGAQPGPTSCRPRSGHGRSTSRVAPPSSEASRAGELLRP